MGACLNRKRFFIPILILLHVSAVCFGGVYTHQRTLYVLQTKYFDIIYPWESTLSAELLAEKADDLYRAACSKFETTVRFRMPVVITPDTDELNAYYTSLPYNRIVLYDTLPEDADSLTSYEDTFISVFYHELVHAVSLNIKSPVMSAVSAVAGDVANLALGIYLPTSFAEGVTVSFESADGYGRLNDSGALHVLQQAKREGKFPSWQQVSGARNIYPAGVPPYMFGGAFAAYLQQKYGMSAYAKYWHECGKIQFFKLAPGIFKKVYGVSLSREWNNFRDSIPLPESADVEHIRESESIQKRGLYKSLAACPQGIAWIETVSGKVRWLPQTSLNTRAAKRKAETLFRSDLGAERLSFSADGAYLAFTHSTQKSGTAKNEVRVFDMNKRRFIGKPLRGIRDACIVALADGNEYLAGVAVFSQYSEIRLYRLADICAYGTEKTAPVFSKVFAYGNVPYALCGASAGNLVYSEKRNARWFFSLWNPADDSEHSWEIPRGRPAALQRIPAESRNDFSASAEFICEWHPATAASAEGNTGFLKEPIPVTRSMRIMLSGIGTDPVCMISEQQNIFSGGSFYPALMRSGSAANGEAETSKLFFVTKKYEYDEIHALPDAAALYAPFAALEPCAASAGNAIAAPHADKSGADALIFSSREHVSDAVHSPIESEKRFHALLNLRKGMLVPLSLSDGFGTGGRLMSDKTVLSYFTMDPTQTWYLLSEFGIDIKSDYYGALLQIGHSTPRLEQAVQFAVDSDFEDDVVFDGLYLIQKTYQLLKNHSAISVQNAFSYTYADISPDTRQSSIFDGHELLNTLLVSFSDFHMVGLGAYETSGFSVSAGARMCLRFIDETRYPYAVTRYVHPVFSVSAALPRLLPFKNPQGKTINMPLFASCSLFPAESTSDNKDIFTAGNCAAVLFSQEIQRGVWVLYAQRLTCSVSYNWQLLPAGGTMPYSSLKKMFAVPTETLLLRQYVSLKIGADCSGIGGYLLNNVLKIGAEVQYHFNPGKENRMTYSVGLLTGL
ncbi:MAG: hypothetical protein NC041_05505 [Bacteroides sp.]|nr:hypothetical protein [Prevotella sp.]MCM1407413.1 hypothetical protein [Treponema brennaborense]MCM1469903.1 hypothetical protein [Bacteroides sp.]